ncbi:MAG: ribonuclease HII [Flavobacteriales bacterium]|jgi:ribonuclease HII
MALKRFLYKGVLEAGCDEAGRGCLSGPVVAGAVILQTGKGIAGLNDSKKLSEAMRNELRPVIEQNALAWGIGVVSCTEIDEINILQASFLAMHRAVMNLGVLPEHLLIDGNRFRPFDGIDHTCLIKGDQKFQSIAAASILAKTFRDDLMQGLHAEFPAYNWAKNKGYPTVAHREAIQSCGTTPHHRMSFQLLPK